MNNKIIGLSVVLFLSVVNVGCAISYPNSFIDKNALYLNGKMIERKTVLVISLENKSGFNIDAKNISKDTLIVKRENIDKVVLPSGKITLKVDSGSALEFINKSNDNLIVDIKIYNHNSKIVQRVYGTEN